MPHEHTIGMKTLDSTGWYAGLWENGNKVSLVNCPVLKYRLGGFNADLGASRGEGCCLAEIGRVL